MAAETRKIKRVSIDQNSTFPVDMWIPANGKFVDTKWFSFSVIQTGTGLTSLNVRIVRGGESAPIIVMAADETITIDSDQKDLPVGISSDTGNGTNSVLKVDKFSEHNATAFKANIVVVGDEL